MKKELTKEDLIAYLKTLPESLWLGLPGASGVIRDAAIATLQKEGLVSGSTSFSIALCGAMPWDATPQGDKFWRTLYEKLSENVGIDIPDPSTVAPNPFKVGMKVLLKTIEELKATLGVTESGMRLSDGNLSFVAPMYPLAGTVVTVAEVCLDDGTAKICTQEPYWWISPYMVKAFNVEELTPYISKADDPRVKDLIGKEVYCADELSVIGSHHCYHSHFYGVSDDENLPFRMPLNYKYIRPMEEEPAVEVTMADVCKAFGKNVKIKKA